MVLKINECPEEPMAKAIHIKDFRLKSTWNSSMLNDA
jgi:hypothetical protein